MTTKLDAGHDLAFYQRCGVCKGTLFFEGPHGGLSINVRCIKCGTTYWIAPPDLGMAGVTEQDADLFKGPPRTIGEIFDWAYARARQAAAEERKKAADRVDGYDRDDLGESRD